MAPTWFNIDALPMNGGLSASRWATPNSAASPSAPASTASPSQSQHPVVQQAQTKHTWAPQGNGQSQGSGVQPSSIAFPPRPAPIAQELGWTKYGQPAIGTCFHQEGTRSSSNNRPSASTLGSNTPIVQTTNNHAQIERAVPPPVY